MPFGCSGLPLWGGSHDYAPPGAQIMRWNDMLMCSPRPTRQGIHDGSGLATGFGPAIRWRAMRDLTDAPPDKRAAEALVLVESKRGADGRWLLEHALHDELPMDPDERDGEPSGGPHCAPCVSYAGLASDVSASAPLPPSATTPARRRQQHFGASPCAGGHRSAPGARLLEHSGGKA